MDIILSFVALILILHLGFALLALSQDRNWRLVIAAPPPSRAGKIVLRAAGSGLLALGLPLALVRDGPGFGSLLWGTMTSVAACAVTLTLSWRPSWLKPLAHTVRGLIAFPTKTTNRAGLCKKPFVRLRTEGPD